MLAALQRGLERLYRVETDLAVDDFLIDAPTRAALFQGRAPREPLLLAEQGGELRLALFVDERTLANLAAHDPRERLDDRNLADFLLTVEGVSHFVYVAWRARQDRPVTALELELQAEVDKYVTCLLTLEPAGRAAHAELRRRIFDRWEPAPGLDADERDRYRVANANASAYAASLEARFARPGDLLGMLAELRRFYRLGAGDKLGFIAAAA